MRILHLLSQRPEMTGSGIYVRELIQQAAAQGHENALLAGIPDDFDHSILDGLPLEKTAFVEFECDDLPFPVVGMSDSMPYDSCRFLDLADERLECYIHSFRSSILKLVQEFSPDIIHANHLWLAASVARQACPEVKVVASCHGTDLRQFRNCTHLREVVRSGCTDLDGALALSPFQVSEISQLYAISSNDVHVTGVGYNSELFSPVDDKPFPEPVRLLFAGKICKAKGVESLLRAVATIDRDFIIDIAGGGQGAEYDELVLQMKALGGRVRFHGAVPQTELAAMMKQAHIFVLPSYFEGLPLVLVEAHACGCRLVATELPGAMELFGGEDEECIRVVPMPKLHNELEPEPADLPEFEAALSLALTQQIDTVLAHNSLYYSERILAENTWAGVFKRIGSVYERVLKA
ncbi:MAG: glycosyltransferase family 4 protein [Desulfovibrio sp.]